MTDPPTPVTAHALVNAFYDHFVHGDPGRIRELLAPEWRDHPADPGRSDDIAGHPARQRPAAFSAMDMHRIAGDRIAETWHFEHLEGLAGDPSSRSRCGTVDRESGCQIYFSTLLVLNR